MANFIVPDNPEFSEEIRQLEPTDPAHSSIFNTFVSKLFNNTLFNKKKMREHEQNLENPHGVTTQQIGAATTDALDAAYQNGNAYTDDKIAGLINGAPSTMDTLREIADAMATNENVVQALEASIGSKASKAEFDTHEANKNTHITADERTKWNTVDSVFSTTSKFPVENRVIKQELDNQSTRIDQVNSNLGVIVGSYVNSDGNLVIRYDVGAENKEINI